MININIKNVKGCEWESKYLNSIVINFKLDLEDVLRKFTELSELWR